MVKIIDAFTKHPRILRILIILVISSLVIVSSYEFYDIEKVSREIKSLDVQPAPISNITKKLNLSNTFIGTNYYQYEGNNIHQYVINATAGNFSDRLNGRIIVDPSYFDGTFFVPITNTTLCNGGLDAVNSTTGKLVWNITFPNEVMTEPLIIGYEVVIGLGNNQFQSPDVRGTGINYIAALNISDGSPIWQFGTYGEDMPTPVYYHGLIIEPTGGGIVYGINATTGNQVWNTYIGSFVSMSSPAIYNGTVYFGGANPYNFYALNALNGNIDWEYCTNATAGLTDGSPVITHGQVIDGYTVGLGDNIYQAYVISFNVTSGNVMWITYEGTGIQPEKPPIEIPPLTANGNFVFSEPTALKELFAINVTNGQIAWFSYTGYDDSNAAIVCNQIITVNLSGYMLVFNSTGFLKMSYYTGAAAGPGTVIVMKDHLVLFGINGVFESIPYIKSTIFIR